jgi:hypothetical protein
MNELYMIPTRLRQFQEGILKAYTKLKSKEFKDGKGTLDSRMFQTAENPITELEVAESVESYFKDCIQYCRIQGVQLPEITPGIQSKWMQETGLFDNKDLNNEQIYFLSEISRQSIKKVIMLENPIAPEKNNAPE